MIGIEAPLVNAFRRIMISEVKFGKEKYLNKNC